MPIRILQIVNYMDRGGLETMLMNCYRHIDRNAVQFDFLVHRDFRAAYDDEIEALGGKIYRLPRLNPFSISYKKALKTFFWQHPEYKIVHCHQDCLSAVPLKIAKQCGVPVRIAHSHNSNQDQNWKFIIKSHYMKKTPAVATHFFACSEAAGKFMFPGQSVTIIKNGIETEKYSFDPAIRTVVREELGLKDQLVVGHVGRFMPQKNHTFLIDVFAKVFERNVDARLLVVGEGPHEAEIRDKVSKAGLTEHVIFLGLRTDVHRLLQAVDVFVLPSLYEGLGIVAVEAQSSGAFCVLSDRVPDECKMTDNVQFISLEESPSVWADHILTGASVQRTDKSDQVVANGYDIQTTADYLQDFYTKMW